MEIALVTMENGDFSSSKFKEVAMEALVKSSKYIREVILGKTDLTEYAVKGDKTLVTFVDKKSQDISTPIIKKAFPNLNLNQEESGGDKEDLGSDIVLYHDPLDGTRGFLIGGATSTIILAAYNRKKKQVLAVATMEPSTGRFWFSARKKGAFLNYFDYGKKEWGSDWKRMKVNGSEISQAGSVLVDANHSFKRKIVSGSYKRILTSDGRLLITKMIEEERGKEASIGGSNGLHYSLVAMGRPTLVGNITTAVGGPFDIAGLLHVVEAGGVAQCYYLTDNREICKLESQNIESADIAIAANSPKTLDLLEQAVSASMKVS